MCPACIATAAVIVVGVASTGGLTVVATRQVIKRRRAKTKENQAIPTNNPNEGS